MTSTEPLRSDTFASACAVTPLVHAARRRFIFFRLAGQEPTQRGAVVHAVGVNQDFGVTLVHPDLPATTRPRGGGQGPGVDLVVHLDSIISQDQPQRPGGGDRGVQRHGHADTWQQARHVQPHIATLNEGERADIVRPDDDLVVGAILPTTPVAAHQPRQERVRHPFVCFERGIEALPFGLVAGVAGDGPAHGYLRRRPARSDVTDCVPHDLLPRVGQHPEPFGRPVGHPVVPNHPVGHPCPVDRPVPLPHQRPDPTQPASLLGQQRQLSGVEILRVGNPGDLHRASSVGPSKYDWPVVVRRGRTPPSASRRRTLPADRPRRRTNPPIRYIPRIIPSGRQVSMRRHH